MPKICSHRSNKYKSFKKTPNGLNKDSVNDFNKFYQKIQKNIYDYSSLEDAGIVHSVVVQLRKKEDSIIICIFDNQVNSSTYANTAVELDRFVFEDDNATVLNNYYNYFYQEFSKKLGSECPFNDDSHSWRFVSGKNVPSALHGFYKRVK